MASGTSKMREHVARTHAAARQAQHLSNFQPDSVDLERQALDQAVVLSQ
jgi:hypothetical protein